MCFKNAAQRLTTAAYLAWLLATELPEPPVSAQRSCATERLLLVAGTIPNLITETAVKLKVRLGYGESRPWPHAC